MSITALTLLMLLLAAQAQEGQEELAYFEEPRRALELITVLDLRYIQADSTASWLDAELGKARYGGDGTDGRSLFRIPQASIVFNTRATGSLFTHVHVNLDLEPEHPGGRYGWDRIRLVEAFADWRWNVAPPLELRVKGGLFFPPISLENVGEAWSTFYTVTPSAINAWVGEEIRSTGVELTLAHVGSENELSVKGAVFWNNDPAGSLLAYRGFALHDRQTGYRDRLPLPDIPSIEPAGTFEQQAPWVEPLFEIDGRHGYYGAIAWESYRFFQLNALYFDNRGIPDRFDGRQYAWKTRFANVGAVVFLPREMELLAQYLDGNTDMGFRGPRQPRVAASFRSWYVLFTAPVGRQRLSLRYEPFRVRDRDIFREPDPSDEDGDAWTFDYLVRVADRHRIGVELMRIHSERPSRASIGLPVRATEWIFQLSLRLQF